MADAVNNKEIEWRLVRALAYEFDRIDAMATMEHFEMQIWPCCPARVAHEGHGLTFFYHFAYGDQVF